MKNVPHFLRFARALALVSGAVAATGCGSATEPGPTDVPSTYDGGPVGVAVHDSGYDGGSTGVSDAPSAWDGFVTGVAPFVDAGSDARITGALAYDSGTGDGDASHCCGIMAYDAGTGSADAVVVSGGIMAYDAGTGDGDASAPPDVRVLPGGPMMPPEMPEDYA